jgi:hypothetical protein
LGGTYRRSAPSRATEAAQRAKRSDPG